MKISAEVVKGQCPTCTEHTILVSIDKGIYRCMNCGTDHSAEIAVLEEKVNALETADTSHTHEVGEHKHEEHGHTKILINEKQIEIIKNQIQELKERSDNPLAG